MTRSILRTATIAMAIAALAAPAALARPADMPAAAGALAAPHRQAQQASAIVGDSPADFAQPVAPAPPLGDTPADHPGMSREPKYDPPANSRPDTTPTAPADHGIAWTTIAIGIAGSLLAIGAIAGITSHTRRAGRARIAA